MERNSEKYRIAGNTYDCRFYLSLCGCKWNGIVWITDDPNLKTRLGRLGMTENQLSKLRLEKIKS